MNNNINLIIIFLVCISIHRLVITHAHIGEHEYIILLTKQIEEDPENSHLYFKRGEQQRLAGHFDSALIDFATTESLDSDYHLVDLVRGQLFLDFGWYITAEFYLKRFIENSPKNIVALISLARSISAQGKGKEASEIYSLIFDLVPNPSPEFFIEMANSYLIDNNHTEALNSLDEGIERIGDITSLYKKALDIEIENNMYPQALIRIDKLIEYSPQKEKWIYRKGKLLESHGEYEEAQKSYTKALEYLETRPPNKRKIPVFIELEKEIKIGLDRVSQKL